MSFQHMPTFLRSAIARDPFCHGGIITPKDVLRLEAKFPTLFDKPAHPPVPPTFTESQESGNEEDPDPGECKKSMNELESNKKVMRGKQLSSSEAVPANSIRPKCHEKYSKFQAKVKTNPLRTTCQAPGKQFSEFHRKCIENKTYDSPKTLGQRKKAGEPTKSSKSTGGVCVARESGGGSSSSKLTRPAQSFSLEDLKATLKKVMEEEALHYGKGLRYPDNKHREPSPYTEDLVKKFLGRKMQMGRGTHKQTKAMKASGGPAGGSCLLEQDEANYGRPKLSTVPSTTMPKERGIPRIRSAPGFLRGISELPPVRKYQKKRMPLSMPREIRRQRQGAGEGEVDAERNNIMTCQESVGGAGDSGENGRKHVTWGENCEKEKRVGVIVKTQYSEESIRKQGSMRPASIHLSAKKHSPAPTQQNAQEICMEKSSYHQLLAARSEKSRYDLKGLLRKQDVPCNFYTKQVEREDKDRRIKREQHTTTYYDSSSDCPSESYARKMREMGQQSKDETNKALEKIAQELVYMEVLHQIDMSKRDQEQEGGNKQQVQKRFASCAPSVSQCQRDDEGLPTPVNLPEFIGTTTTDLEAVDTCSGSGGGVNKEGWKSSVQEINLKTPELTPPSVGAHYRKQGKGSSHERNESSVEMAINLRTPELSPSPNKRLIAAIKERNQLLGKKQKEITSSPPHHMDTDCSEMSDFVFSEPSKRQGANHHQGDEIKTQKKESVKLETPKLSSSPMKHQVSSNDHSPEKDENTSSGAPSTFLENPTKNEQNDDDDNGSKTNEIKSSVKYSDDFIPEKELDSSNISLDPSFVHSSDDVGVEENFPMMPSDINENFNESDAESNDNIGKLNISNETVIDLLSEGEFIGKAYRSPGELSLRHRHASPPPTSFSSRSVPTSSQRNRQSPYMCSTVASGKGDDVESSISILSIGIQIAGHKNEEHSHYDASLGECP